MFVSFKCDADHGLSQIEAWCLKENELRWDTVPALVKATGRPLPTLESDLQSGDVIFMSLRNGSFQVCFCRLQDTHSNPQQGGSTVLGDLRLKITRRAQEYGLRSASYRKRVH